MKDFAEPSKRRRGGPLALVPSNIAPQFVDNHSHVMNAPGALQEMHDRNSTNRLNDRREPIDKADASMMIVLPRVSSFIREPIHGHRPLSLCSQPLSQAIEKVNASHSSHMDHTYMKIKSAYIDTGAKFHACSLVVRSQMLDVDKDELVRKHWFWQQEL